MSMPYRGYFPFAYSNPPRSPPVFDETAVVAVDEDAAAVDSSANSFRRGDDDGDVEVPRSPSRLHRRSFGNSEVEMRPVAVDTRSPTAPWCRHSSAYLSYYFAGWGSQARKRLSENSIMASAQNREAAHAPFDHRTDSVSKNPSAEVAVTNAVA